MNEPNAIWLERPLPSDPVAEKCLIVGAMNDNNLFKFIEGLDPGAFYSSLHRRIFQGMLAAYSKGEILDALMVGDEMKKVGTLDNIGGVAAIIGLFVGVPLFSQKQYLKYLKLVKKAHAARSVIALCNEITSEILSESEDVGATILKADEKILSIYGELNGNRSKQKGFHSIAEIAPEMKERFMAFHYNQIKVVKTGITAVDDQLEGGGMQKNGLYYLAAPPKCGKSSLVLGWAEDAAVNQGFTVLIVSAEMNRIQVATRLYSKYTGIPHFMFRPGFYGQQYEQSLEDLERFAATRIKIADGLFNVNDINRYASREQEMQNSENPVGLIIVDYAQLIGLRADMIDVNKRTSEVTAVSREFKLMAGKLGVPVLAISTMNRDSSRENRAPEMFDLRESGALEYDAEVVWALHNPNYKPGIGYQRQPVEDINLLTLANRGGPNKTVPLKFVGEFMSFLSQEEYFSIEQKQMQKRNPVMGQNAINQEEIHKLTEEIDF